MIFTKISETFQMSDYSAYHWYSYGSIQYNLDKSIEINLSIYHNTKQDTIYVICFVDPNGKINTELDGFKEEYDYFTEYVNFLIDSILEYFKS